MKNKILYNSQKKQFPEVPNFTSSLEIKPEFEQQRSKLHSALSNLTEPVDAKEVKKQFKFGLSLQRNRTPPPKPKRDNIQPKGVEDISCIQDYPVKVHYDSFEEFSIAKSSAISKHLELIEKEISVFADLCPKALDNRSSLQFPQADLAKINFDKLEWPDISNIITGRVSQSSVYHKLNQTLENKQFKESQLQEPKQLQKPQETQQPGEPQKSLQELQEPQDNPHNSSYQSELMPRIALSEFFGAKKTESLAAHSRQGSNASSQSESDLEYSLVKMIEKLGNNTESEDTDQKLQQLLELAHSKLTRDPHNPKKQKVKLLYDFLMEYKQARESKKCKKPHNKPSVPKVKRSPKKSTTPDRFVTPKEVKTTVMRGGWSTQSRPKEISSRYAPVKEPSKKRSYYNSTASSANKAKSRREQPPAQQTWIGGSKFKDDL
eukprot:CAMPEP_0202428854 /NCGR_PEP_ID=MMETSP1345-20130828/2755_1 /ASSEMBLY_ACC=CAM_ASM_000843 /TAXON_ID=342563 /ORGANISM="Fabrea Fabrea salina" /LENGTH=433 /DNA_ID=CAMNT_0049039935 /DNA_START=53 /DNA_END=1351 /DNA_ORIENTATION=+